VITDLEVGGVPLHLLRLAVGVRDAGWAVRVVALRGGGPVGDRLRTAGVDVGDCGASGPADWRLFERLAQTIAEYQPDLVHALLFHANLAARIAGVLAGFPRRRILTEIQTVEIERRWHLAVERLTWRLSALVIGNSPSVLEHLHQAGGVPRARLRLAPGGIDTAAMRAAMPLSRSALGSEPQEHLLLWTGRLDPIKGLDTLLAAAALLPGALRWRLLLAGDGPLAGALANQAAALGITNRVKFLGRRDDVPRLLKTADLFVFPSRTEGLPNALLEALAAELPVVATQVAGNRDVVTHGVTGRMVPVDDPPALAGAIMQALENRAESRQLAEAGRAWVVENFDLAACVRRYLAVYSELMPVATRTTEVAQHATRVVHPKGEAG
jgi:starch synthase (maltosyl-transferring)